MALRINSFYCGEPIGSDRSKLMRSTEREILSSGHRMLKASQSFCPSLLSPWSRLIPTVKSPPKIYLFFSKRKFNPMSVCTRKWPVLFRSFPSVWIPRNSRICLKLSVPLKSSLICDLAVSFSFFFLYCQSLDFEEHAILLCNYFNYIDKIRY